MVDLKRAVSISPLASLRIIFGLLMVFSTLRFWANGWIYSFYIKPEFFFGYQGLEWVKPLPGIGMYFVFGFMSLAALGIALGFYYRFSSSLFFLLFTYVEVLDKTNYLNHYYFVSILAFLLIFLPAHRRCSYDVYKNPKLKAATIPYWMMAIPKLQLSMVYFFAGIAKLHTDWIFHALPLKLWLPAKSSIPLIGWLFKYKSTAYLFSWFGAIYDLLIPLFLWWKKSVLLAFLLVVVFHVLTWILFPIGIFPWVMIFSTSIFLPEKIHERFLTRIESFLNLPQSSNEHYTPKGKSVFFLFGIHFLFQLLIPLRFLIYPGDVRWNEQGFRFSWRVMVVEKNGSVVYEIKDKSSGNRGIALPSDYLTPLQEKQMSFQPDMILQLGQHIGNELKSKGIDAEVRVSSKVSMNGNENRTFIDPSVDLMKVSTGFGNRNWILPYED